MSNKILAVALMAAALFIANVNNVAIGKEVKDKKVYYLYGDPRPGSKFKQKLFKDVVPFDKRYAELSPGLKARVKAAYGGLKNSEHPPFPTEGTQAIFRPLYKANRELKVEGDVLAIAVVSAVGEVKSVSVYKAPNANLTSIIEYILMNTKFDPATCDGKACEMEYLFENEIETKPNKAR